MASHKYLKTGFDIELKISEVPQLIPTIGMQVSRFAVLFLQVKSNYRHAFELISFKLSWELHKKLNSLPQTGNVPFVILFQCKRSKVIQRTLHCDTFL